MTTFIALYRGQTISSAKVIAVATDSELVPISVNLTGHFGFNLTDLSERKRRWTL